MGYIMNPQHREFFIKLLALVNEYRAEIGQPGAGQINVAIDRTYYKLNGVDAWGTVYVTEQREHVIKHIDEEPQP